MEPRDPKHGGQRFVAAAPAVVREPLPPRVINLLELPTEMLLAVLEWLLRVDPVVLLGAVPGVCRRMRALCDGVRGEFDLRGEWGRLDGREWDEEEQELVGDWSGLKGALSSAARLFPRTRGLWTFSEFALHDACEAGLTVAVGRLLGQEAIRRMADLNRTGETPLFIACEKGYLEVVRLLVENGADINQTVNSWTPLFTACWKGHLEVVQLLAEKGADMDKADAGGTTPLVMACQFGDLDVVRLLVEKGADMNKANASGRTPLYTACWKGRLDVVRLLVEKGADMNKATNDGWTPLIIACQSGYTDVVRLLVEKGADKDKATNTGTTPLSIAQQRGKTEIVAVLGGGPRLLALGQGAYAEESTELV